MGLMRSLHLSCKSKVWKKKGGVTNVSPLPLWKCVGLNGENGAPNLRKHSSRRLSQSWLRPWTILFKGGFWPPKVLGHGPQCQLTKKMMGALIKMFNPKISTRMSHVCMYVCILILIFCMGDLGTKSHAIGVERPTPRRPLTTRWCWRDTQISRKTLAVRFPDVKSPLYLTKIC